MDQGCVKITCRLPAGKLHGQMDVETMRRKGKGRKLQYINRIYLRVGIPVMSFIFSFTFISFVLSCLVLKAI